MPVLRSSLTNKENESGQVRSAGQNEVGQSKQIELAIPGHDLERILNCLKQCSLLLRARPDFSKRVKKDLHQKINDLVERLICLPSSDTQSDQSDVLRDGKSTGKRSGRGDDEESPKKKQRVGENESKPVATQQPVFKIELRLRDEVINHLFWNLNVLVFDKRSSEEARKRIVDQNVSLKSKLLSLPTTSSHAPDELPIDRHITSDFAGTIKWKLKEVSAFLNSESDSVFSKVFLRRGFQWRIKLSVKSKERNGKTVQYLGFDLHCDKPSEDSQRPWSINTIFDFGLLDPVTNTVVRLYRHVRMFTNNNTHGYTRFFKYESLQRKGYICNDRLKVFVKLWCYQPVNETK